MRRVLAVTGLVTDLLIGALSAFVGMLANVHDGYTQFDAFRDYALGLFVPIPAYGALGDAVGRLKSSLID